MGFKELADLDCSVTTAIGGFNKETKKDNPTQIEGYFIGSRKIDSAKAKSGYCFLHVLQTNKGNVGVWGKTNLDQKLSAVQPGTMIRISFQGMVETRNNPMYKYKVEVDESNTIEVNLASSEDNGAEANPHAEGKYDFERDQDEAAVDADEPEEQAPPRAVAPREPAKTPNAASQAKVQALLANARAAKRAS